MKIDGASLSPDTLKSVRGQYYWRVTNGKLIMQKWPSKVPSVPNKTVNWYRKQFGLASSMASNPCDLDYITASNLAKPLINPPRDLLTAAALGTLYTITNPDGSVWPVASHAPPWVHEVPDNPLQQEDDMLEWSGSPWGTSTTGSQGNAAGLAFVPISDVTIKAIRAMVTQTFRTIMSMYVVKMSDTYSVSEILYSADITCAATGNFAMEFPCAMTFSAGVKYAIIFACHARANNAASLLRLSAASPFSFPISFFANVYKQSNVVAVGDVYMAPTGGPWCIGLKI